MSQSDTRILPRAIGGALESALSSMPVVVVMGARQTGKSTLVQTHPLLQNYEYISLDDMDARSLATASPDEFVVRHPRMIIDEIQREPDLIHAIKRAIDRDHPRIPGRFVLTGSANLLLMARISESLAGRAVYLTLRPFTRRERAGTGETGIWNIFLTDETESWYETVRSLPSLKCDWQQEVRIGGYPTPALELSSTTARSTWFRGYVQTYLERDLQDLSAIDNLVDFNRLMRASAYRIGGLINREEIGRDIGVPRPTVHRYINLLVTSFQIQLLEPYSVNRTKRLIRSPKLYWTDTGLALFLAQKEPDGAYFENMILNELMAWRDIQDIRTEILFWRTASNKEVDFVIEQGSVLIPIEVKASPSIGESDIRHLKLFKQEYGKQVKGALVLYTGEETFWAGENILVVPWWKVM